MPKKKRSEKHIHGHHLQAKERISKPQFSFEDIKVRVIGLACIMILTILVYLPVFNAGFAYDDVNYIQKNPLIRTIDLSKIFSENVMGNYHPLTMLVFSIEFQFFGLDPTGYHIVNLLLHLCNVFLVFYSIKLLSNKIEVALFAALLFGIHPLHVESVAWISELKDILYTLFFLGAYIFYLKYLSSKQGKFYGIAILIFIFSLLSKAMAVSLPVILLLTDFFKRRKMVTKVFVEKIPFFLLSIGFGIVAIFAQQLSDAVQEASTYTFFQRVVFACYGFITYLWKLILPLNQSAFYPYTVKSGGDLSFSFYLFPVLVLIIMMAVIYSGKFTRKILFGFLFFSITVFLVLQLLPVGDAIMADRYSYIPSIGVFYLVAGGVYWLWIKKYKTAAIAFSSLFVLFFCIKTFQRVGVWKNDQTLFTDVIEKYPTVALAYNNRGSFFWEEKKYDQALADYNKAIDLRPIYPDALNNRGVVYLDKKNYQAAINDFNQVIELEKSYAPAYSNRGVAFMETGMNAEARSDFNKALEIKPDYAEAYYNRGVLSMNEKKTDEALNDYNKALELNPGYTNAITNRDILLGVKRPPEEILAGYNAAIESNPKDPELYYKRGSLFLDSKKYNEAKTDLYTAIKHRPSYPEAFNALGVVYFDEKSSDSALYYFNKAIATDPTLAEAYLNRGNLMRDQDKHDFALKDYAVAIQLKPEMPATYYNRGILLIKEKNFEPVIEDFSRVIELKGDSAMGYYNIGMAELFLNRKEVACQHLGTAAAMGLQSAIDAQKQFCQ